MTQVAPVTSVPTTSVLSGRIQHGAFDTFYLEAGSGRPVLLIHGSGPGVSGRANWQGTLSSALTVRYRFLAPDIVGFGATRHTADTELTHDARVQQLIGFLDAMEIDVVDIVGNSMGGGLALALAHRFPNRVRRMVLMGTVGISFPISTELDRVWGYTPSMENMADILNLFAYDKSLITDDLIKLRYDASAVPDVQEPYAAAFAAPRQRHLDDMALTDEQLSTITTPTLLIHGRDDRIIPLAATSGRLVEILPQSDLVVFGRCGHWTQIERRYDFHRQVDGFFAA